MAAGTVSHPAIRRFAPLALLLPLVMAACAQTPDASGSIAEGCHQGILTDEGGRCQALRRDGDGAIITFHSDMNGWRLGQRACVCGTRPLMTGCPRDTALEVTWLAPFCPPRAP